MRTWPAVGIVSVDITAAPGGGGARMSSEQVPSRKKTCRAWRIGAGKPVFALILSVWSVGCSGDPGAPAPPLPPALVVTTVDVSPPAGSILVGDTLSMTATARDQNGAPMSGRTFTWSSSTPTVATVTASGQVVGVAQGSTSISATADGRSGTSTVTVAARPPTIAREPANTVTATIGPEGGSVTATSTAGIQYRLEIPPGALLRNQQITMTPIADIQHLGVSGGIAGAVDLQPSGLSFALPGVLRISTSRAPPAGMRLIGFNGSGDLSKREIALSARDASEVAVLVPHFSNVGAAFGRTSEVSLFLPTVDRTLDSLYNAFAAAIGPSTWDAAALANATQQAQQVFQIVLAGFQAASDDLSLLNTFGDYSRWRYMLAVIDNDGLVPLTILGGFDDLTLPADFADELQDVVDAAARPLKLAVDGNLDLCGSQASIEALKNALFWYDWAGRLNVNIAQHGLDLATVLSDVATRCGRVVLQSSNLPDSLPANQNFNLDLQFGFRFRNGTEQPTDFTVDLTGSGVSITNPSGFTGIGTVASPLGFYTTVIRPAMPAFPLRASSCLVVSRQAPDPSPLCDTFRLSRVLYANDFAAPTVGSEWSIQRTSVTPSGQRFLGELRNEDNRLTLDSLPPHTDLILDFDVFIIGSWNGNAELAVAGSPDILEVGIAGGALLKRTTFSNKPRDNQAYPGDFPGSSFPARSGALSTGALGYPAGPDFIGDAVYRIRLTFPHSGPSVTLRFNGNHAGQIERWGIDNVRVSLPP